MATEGPGFCIVLHDLPAAESRAPSHGAFVLCDHVKVGALKVFFFEGGIDVMLDLVGGEFLVAVPGGAGHLDAVGLEDAAGVAHEASGVEGVPAG